MASLGWLPHKLHNFIRLNILSSGDYYDTNRQNDFLIPTAQAIIFKYFLLSYSTAVVSTISNLMQSKRQINTNIFCSTKQNIL